MPEYLTQKEAFLKCKKEGKFFPREEIEIERIRSTLAIAEADLQSVLLLKKTLPKESLQWSSVFKLCYDALHELAEAFLRCQNEAGGPPVNRPVACSLRSPPAHFEHTGIPQISKWFTE